MDNLEKRNQMQRLEIRDNDSGGHIITGYAVIFNQPSEDMGFIETVDPHALDNVDLSKVFALYNHDFANVLARTDTGTLKLSLDDKGLAFSCQIPNTTLGADVYENIRNGNVQGMSFGFTVDDDQWDVDKNGRRIRQVLKLGRLAEISVTCIPAYPETSVIAQRSYEEHRRSQEARERLNLWLNLTEILERFDK